MGVERWHGENVQLWAEKTLPGTFSHIFYIFLKLFNWITLWILMFNINFLLSVVWSSWNISFFNLDPCEKDLLELCVSACLHTLPCSLFFSFYCICVCFRGCFCREAKAAVLAFVIIFNAVTQSESTLSKIPLQCLRAHSYRPIHLFRRFPFRLAGQQKRKLTLCSKLFPNGRGGTKQDITVHWTHCRALCG